MQIRISQKEKRQPNPLSDLTIRISETQSQLRFHHKNKRNLKPNFRFYNKNKRNSIPISDFTIRTRETQSPNSR